MKNVFFRLDCSSDVGLGHIKRCLIIATYFYHWEKTFIIKGKAPKSIVADLDSDAKKIFLGKNLSLDDEVEFLRRSNLSLHGGVVVFDFATPYTFSYSRQFKRYFQYFSDAKTIVFDGLQGDSLLSRTVDFEVDYVLTPYVGARKVCGTQFEHLVGPHLFIFDNDLSNIIKSHKPVLRNILITMGGADPSKITQKVLDAIFMNKDLLATYNFQVVIGQAFNELYVRDIKEKASRFDVVVHENQKSLENCFKWADMCITTTGLTKYELAKIAMPMITIAHDEISNRANTVFETLGISCHLGMIQDIELEEIANRINNFCLDDKLRKKMFALSNEMFKDNTDLSKIFKRGK